MLSGKKITKLGVWFVCLMFAMASGISWAESSAHDKVLQIGILPTLSARLLLKNYQPLQMYLERALNRPVELVTANDFSTFHLNTIEGKFDLIVTAAHMARLAQTEAKYVPLTTYKAVNRAVLLESKDQPLQSIQGLKGKSLAFGDRQALIVSQAIGYLRDNGLREGIDYTLLDTQSHNSAAYSVQKHQSALAITSPSGYKNMPDQIKESVKIFMTLPEFPGLMWMAHPRVASDAPKFKAALLGFTADTAEGKQFYESTGYIGMREIGKDEMKSLDPYTKNVGTALRPVK